MTETRLPDFLVIGARRSGTTLLDALLRQHPQIHLPTRAKETFYFDRYYHRGPEWYRGYFSDAPSDGRIGEVTPSYMATIEAPARVRETLGTSVRLVALLRDPLDRAWSDYLHALRRGDLAPDTPLERAVSERPSIVAESRYGEQLERWASSFSAGAIHVSLFEALVDDPQSCLDGIHTHLSVPAHRVVPPDDAARNAARESRHPLAARIGHRVSRTLHRAGLHNVVDAAKRLGAGGVLERRSSRRPTASETEILGQLLGGERERFVHLSLDTRAWRDQS